MDTAQETYNRQDKTALTRPSSNQTTYKTKQNETRTQTLYLVCGAAIKNKIFYSVVPLGHHQAIAFLIK